MKLPLRWNLMMTNKKEKSFFFVCMDCFLLHVTQTQGRGIDLLFGILKVVVGG